tara:strand:+ start:91 stop:312 length:222 start_codon:yes stop_codon:yes gene_type:complete
MVKKMAFRFNLGDIVIPTTDNPERRLPKFPATVAAIQLDGLIEIEFPGSPHKLLVEDKYYELWSEAPTLEFNH